MPKAVPIARINKATGNAYTGGISMAMRISVSVGMKVKVTIKATSACIPTSTDRNIPCVNPYAIKPSTMAMASRLANV